MASKSSLAKTMWYKIYQYYDSNKSKRYIQEKISDSKWVFTPAQIRPSQKKDLAKSLLTKKTDSW